MNTHFIRSGDLGRYIQPQKESRTRELVRGQMKVRPLGCLSQPGIHVFNWRRGSFVIPALFGFFCADLRSRGIRKTVIRNNNGP